MRGFQAPVWIIVAAFCVSLSQAQENSNDMCAKTFCGHGRMCTPYRDGSREWTTCECPLSCPNDNVPVCTHYNVEFANLCEMHKFACEHELTLRVKNAGPCASPPKPGECSERQMLGFPSRYLEWIMIAKGMSEDRNYKLTVRGEALSKKERTDVLVWEFIIMDKNKNDLIDEEECDSVVGAIQLRETCIEGFIKSCDYNGDSALEFREWIGCFPEGDSQSNSIGSRLRL